MHNQVNINICWQGVSFSHYERLIEYFTHTFSQNFIQRIFIRQETYFNKITKMLEWTKDTLKMPCFPKDVLMSMVHVTTKGHEGCRGSLLPPEAMLMFMAHAVARNPSGSPDLHCLWL